MNPKLALYSKFLILSGAVFMADCSDRAEYAAVIDAGSSGSRIRVYQIENSGKDSIPKVFEIGNEDKSLQMKIEPGISELRNKEKDSEINSENIKDYLSPLFSAGKQILLKKGLSEKQIRNVPIYLGATAGVRRLLAERQAKLMSLTSSALKDSGFLSKGALVLSGEFEGVYAWICVNSMRGTLGGAAHQTFGIIEMGGASTQITFVPELGPSQSPRRFRLGGIEYPLYSYSYNALGINEARTLLYQSECRNTKGNYQKCKSKIADNLNADRFCGTTSTCGLQGVSQPPPKGNFTALGNFANLGSDLGLTHLSPMKLDEAGAVICTNTEKEIKEKFPALKDTPQKFLNGVCFHTALTSVMLGGNLGIYDGLGFSADPDSIEAARTINGEAPSWTKGLVIMEKTGNRTWESE